MELQIHNLRKAVIDSINNSNMPLSLVYYVLNDILVEINEMRKQELVEEQNARAQEQATEVIEEEDLNI